MPRIFICYRRLDSGGYAGRLHDVLATAFGNENVFIDIAGILPGRDFEDVLRHTLDRADAVLVLIGRRWLEADESGRRRLDNADDVVGLEVATALARAVSVVPILVGGSVPPRSEELPIKLRGLAKLHHLELSDSRWLYDTERLVNLLSGETSQAVPEWSRTKTIACFLVLWVCFAARHVPYILGSNPLPQRPVVALTDMFFLTALPTAALTAYRLTRAWPIPWARTIPVLAVAWTLAYWVPASLVDEHLAEAFRPYSVPDESFDRKLLMRLLAGSVFVGASVGALASGAVRSLGFAIVVGLSWIPITFLLILIWVLSSSTGLIVWLYPILATVEGGLVLLGWRSSERGAGFKGLLAPVFVAIATIWLLVELQ